MSPLALRALALAGLLVALAATSAGAATPRASLPDIEDEVMCLACGTPLSVATESPQAERERAFIRTRIAAGDDKSQIKERLVAQYGPGVLAEPRSQGFDVAAWLVPAALGALGVALVALLLPRWRRRRGPGDPDDRAPAAPAVSSGDARRLDEELRRFDGGRA